MERSPAHRDKNVTEVGTTSAVSCTETVEGVVATVNDAFCALASIGDRAVYWPGRNCTTYWPPPLAWTGPAPRHPRDRDRGAVRAAPAIVTKNVTEVGPLLAASCTETVEEVVVTLNDSVCCLASVGHRAVYWPGRNRATYLPPPWAWTGLAPRPPPVIATVASSSGRPAMVTRNVTGVCVLPPLSSTGTVDGVVVTLKETVTENDSIWSRRPYVTWACTGRAATAPGTGRCRRAGRFRASGPPLIATLARRAACRLS